MMVVGAGERLYSAAFVLLAAGALGFLYLFNPASTSIYPTCPFFWATGCYCPGCGSLRALHQLTRGHLAAALGLNPLMVLSLPFLGYHALSQAKLMVTGRALKSIFVGPRPIWALLGLIFLLGLEEPTRLSLHAACALSPEPVGVKSIISHLERL